MLFSCQVVKTVEPVVRPKGLGLGAAKPKQQEVVAPKEGEEKLELKKGAFIRVESGRKAGLYGEVEGFDEENARYSFFYLLIFRKNLSLASIMGV